MDPALKWAEENRDKLSKGRPSNFEFQLHGLRYMHILKTEGQKAALNYAKKHFSPFTKDHMTEIQRLVGHLIYTNHPTAKSPYKDTYMQQWDQIAAEFVKQACNLIGQVRTSF